MKSHILLSIFLCLSTLISSQEVIQLYDGLPPGSEDWTWSEAENNENIWQTRLVYNVVQPTLTAYIPPYYKATGTAVVIAPGGGYHALSIDSEGIQLAEYLRDKGVAAFVLKYRLVHCKTTDPATEIMQKDQELGKREREAVAPLAIADGLKAIEWVRSNATEYEIDPDKIGIIGFSAGGHLTMGVTYNADATNRPNFIAPIYASVAGLDHSNVPEERTPAFIAVSADDQLGLMPESLTIFDKWTAAKQPVELHVYEKGGHGFGMRTRYLPSDTWYERFGDWMHSQGYLKKLHPNKYEKLYGQDEVARSQIGAAERKINNFAQLDRYKTANSDLAAPAKKEKRVVLLGNSITEGWANQNPDFFIQNNFIGRGISGQTSSQLLLRFRQDVIDLTPKAVVIHIGTNDIAENTGPYDADYTMSNIESMVDLAKKHKIKVILASVLPHTKFEWRPSLGDPSEKVVDLNRRLKALCAQHKLAYVDYHSVMKNADNGMDADLADDGVHPTEKGFEVMESILVPVVNKVVKR